MGVSERSVLSTMASDDLRAMPPVSSHELEIEEDDDSEIESDAVMRQRLVTSLSQSFPGSALTKALNLMDTDDVDGDLNLKAPELSSSCFAELRLEKGSPDDDELTSLAWLQDKDILKIADEEEKEPEVKVEEKPRITLQTPYNPLKHVSNKPPYSFSCLIFMAIEDSPIKRLPVKDIYNWILTHFPYFQNAPTGWKNSVRHNLSLNKCFKKVEKERGHSLGKGSLWCIDPDYRPNLLQALRKTPYHPYHQLQMMHNAVNSTECGVLQPNPQYAHVANRMSFNTPSPRLFPFLSRRLAQSKQEPAESVLDIDVANALVSLKGNAASRSLDSARWRELKAARDQVSSRKRHRSASPPEFGSEAYRRRKLKEVPPPHIICTRSPSEDHTYSVPDKRRNRQPDPSLFAPLLVQAPRHPLSDVDVDVDSISDSSYHSSSSDDSEPEEVVRRSDLELPVKKRFRSRLNFESQIDDQVKEGANALLNLAGIRTGMQVPLRSISPISSNNNNNHIIKQEVAV